MVEDELERLRKLVGPDYVVIRREDAKQLANGVKNIQTLCYEKGVDTIHKKRKETEE